MPIYLNSEATMFLMLKLAEMGCHEASVGTGEASVDIFLNCNVTIEKLDEIKADIEKEYSLPEGFVFNFIGYQIIPLDVESMNMIEAAPAPAETGNSTADAAGNITASAPTGAAFGGGGVAVAGVLNDIIGDGSGPNC